MDLKSRTSGVAFVATFIRPLLRARTTRRRAPYAPSRGRVTFRLASGQTCTCNGIAVRRRALVEKKRKSPGHSSEPSTALEEGNPGAERLGVVRAEKSRRGRGR